MLIYTPNFLINIQSINDKQDVQKQLTNVIKRFEDIHPKRKWFVVCPPELKFLCFELVGKDRVKVLYTIGSNSWFVTDTIDSLEDACTQEELLDIKQRHRSQTGA